MSRNARRIAGAAAIDVVAIVVFVALGRGAHDEGSAVTGTLEIAAPFVIAAALGWLAARAWRAPFDVWRTGIPVWLVTVAAGMVLRHTVFDRGTALPFVIVATGMLGLFILGWRTLSGFLLRRRSPTVYDPGP